MSDGDPAAQSAASERALDRLRDAGLVRDDDQGRPRTTRRWQAAMMRAVAKLMADGKGQDGGEDDGSDLRVPIAWALVEVLGADVPDSELVDLVEAMLSIEQRELDPGTGGGPSPP